MEKLNLTKVVLAEQDKSGKRLVVGGANRKIKMYCQVNGVEILSIRI